VPRPKLWISLFILLAIGLHAVPVVFYQGQRQTRWPFLAWAMYAKSLPPGPIETKQRRLVGITQSGVEEALSAPLVGVTRSTYGRTYIQPMWAGDSSAARQLVARLNPGREDPFVAVRLEGETYTVTDTGVVKAPFSPIVYRVDTSGAR
jgi:hypothetical protein